MNAYPSDTDAWEHITERARDPHVYEALIQWLDDDDDRRRFVALFILINSCRDWMQRDAQRLGPRFLQLMFDESNPVNDRARWALRIIGDTGFDLLLAAYGEPEETRRVALLCMIASHPGVHARSDWLTREACAVLESGTLDDRVAIALSTASMLRNAPEDYEFPGAAALDSSIRSVITDLRATSDPALHEHARSIEIMLRKRR